MSICSYYPKWPNPCGSYYPEGTCTDIMLKLEENKLDK